MPLGHMKQRAARLRAIEAEKPAPKVPKIKIDWCFVDVKLVGRHQLEKIVGTRNDLVRRRIPITITGFLDDVVSRDDGTSIEFGVTVSEAKLGTPTLV